MALLNRRNPRAVRCEQERVAKGLFDSERSARGMRFSNPGHGVKLFGFRKSQRHQCEKHLFESLREYNSRGSPVAALGRSRALPSRPCEATRVARLARGRRLPPLAE